MNQYLLKKWIWERIWESRDYIAGLICRAELWKNDHNELGYMCFWLKGWNLIMLRWDFFKVSIFKNYCWMTTEFCRQRFICEHVPKEWKTKLQIFQFFWRHVNFKPALVFSQVDNFHLEVGLNFVEFFLTQEKWNVLPFLDLSSDVLLFVKSGRRFTSNRSVRKPKRILRERWTRNRCIF